jgi:hypothetical protein
LLVAATTLLLVLVVGLVSSAAASALPTGPGLGLEAAAGVPSSATPAVRAAAAEAAPGEPHTYDDSLVRARGDNARASLGPVRHAYATRAGAAVDDVATSTKPWLRGSSGNAGRVPESVRSALEGQTFTSREAFRSSFWQAAADDPALAGQFSRSNVSLMRSGRAPVAPSSQHFGGRIRYELHHITPVSRGGGAYDLDNIIVATPRYHHEVLSPSYHYGGGG